MPAAVAGFQHMPPDVLGFSTFFEAGTFRCDIMPFERKNGKEFEDGP